MLLSHICATSALLVTANAENYYYKVYVNHRIFVVFAGTFAILDGS